jgi:hypothetical protein
VVFAPADRVAAGVPAPRRTAEPVRAPVAMPNPASAEGPALCLSPQRRPIYEACGRTASNHADV